MKKIYSVLIVVLALGVLQQGIGNEEPTTTIKKTIVQDTGKVKYETYCSMCHGLNGKGASEVTKTFEVEPSTLVSQELKEKSDKELQDITKNGVEGTKMLAWGKLLSDEEIGSITGYVRELQKES